MMARIIDGVDITTAVLCEEVRPELNGKWTLLGVFPGDMAVPETPANVRLGLYLEAHVTKPYTGPLNIRFRLNDKEIMVAQGKLESQQGFVALPLGSVIVGFPEPGTIFVDLSADSKNWIEVLSKKLVIGALKDGIFIPSSTS